MAKQITDELKKLFAAQGVTATGDTIAEVLKSGYEYLNDATVSGNLIADIIAQCAETGTFPGGGGGGGAAPTFVNEMTWDGDTTGLESVELYIGEEEPTKFYKISDSVLPFGCYADTFPDGTGYAIGAYSATDNNDDTVNLRFVALNGCVTFGPNGGNDLVISTYYDNYQYEQGEAAPEGQPTTKAIPSAGTWFADVYFEGQQGQQRQYFKKITATTAEE